MISQGVTIMPRMTHDSLCNDWVKISDKLSIATKGMADASLAIILAMTYCEAGSKEYNALDMLFKQVTLAENTMSGLSYLAHPQSEWLGGNDYVVRAPHIVCSVNGK